MADPIIIQAQPATLQVRTTAMASARRGDHALVIGEAQGRGGVEYHGACSCGNWSASHHTDVENLKSVHAKHVAKKKEAANG